MSSFIGVNKKARQSYGFDEIALSPGSVTINPKKWIPIAGSVITKLKFLLLQPQWME